jgi:uncharacterized protein YjbI with pentapeptide repeats
MANEEQLTILRQGVDAWNKWREKHVYAKIDLIKVDLSGADLTGANLREANLADANLSSANLTETDLTKAYFYGANLSGTDLSGADLLETRFEHASLIQAKLLALITGTRFDGVALNGADFSNAPIELALFADSDLSVAIGLDRVVHDGPAHISTSTLVRSKGQIPEAFLRGCGLSDWEIEAAKLYNPDLSNDEFIDIQNRIFNLRQLQAIQISPLFISYSHANSDFIDKMESQLNKKGIRFWRDIHDMKAGRIEKQIDRAIRQNPTVLLVLSERALSSDWVEHEVRTAREFEKDMGRDVLCPVALDHSWKSSGWPKRIMEQITEYNILDFSEWQDDRKFEGMFRKLIDGLELFYKGS